MRKRLGIDPRLTAGKPGVFDVLADGETVASRGGNWFTRKLGAGYPDFDDVVAELEKRRS